MSPHFESLENRQLLAAVSIRGNEFYIDGQITHRGAALEGTLPNIRAVNATFDDANGSTRWRWKYPDTGRWDPNRNVNEFVRQLPSWRRAGVLAATLSFQGGGPVDGQFGAYQPWNNTAFNSDGSLKSAYLSRLEKAIRALDQNGMVAIVNYFYLGQEHRLRDQTAVYRAADNATRWLVGKGFRNVMVDVANESSSLYKYPILEPSRIHSLIGRIKSISGGALKVGTSFLGGVLPSSSVVGTSDVIFLHGNGKQAWQINNMIDTMRARTSKPIVFNEDSTNLANFREATKNGASWGYYDQGRNNYFNGFQSPAIRWSFDSPVKQAFVAELKRLGAAGQVAAPSTGSPTITRLMLIDARRDRVIGELTSGMVIDPGRLGTSQFSVQARTEGGAESVRFGFAGRTNYRTESHEPFTLGGDAGADYLPVNMNTGWHSVAATPFTGDSATGRAGATLAIRFRIAAPFSTSTV